MGSALDTGASYLGIGNQGPQVGANTQNRGLGQLTSQNELYSDPEIMRALQAYAAGNQSSADFLDSMKTSGINSTLGQTAELQNALATGPLTGSKYATEQVRNNALLGGLFGQGGQLEKAQEQYNQLANQGFQLQPQDITAYGQASGDIARLFGAQEQGLAQSLADRGLASAPSGAAGVGFTGLQGNKNEMLAKAQMDIANQRMQNTMQRMGQLQSYIGNLGQQGANAINQQFGRQSEGAQSQRAGLMGTAGLQGQENLRNFQQQMESFGTRPATIMDQAIGDAGTASSSFAKSFGSLAGSMAGGGGPSSGGDGTTTSYSKKKTV